MVLDWLNDFLSARTQCVRIQCSLSAYCDFTSGVPQGSVLRPILFALFINDIVNYTEKSVRVKIFADDTKLYAVISDEFWAARLQSCLDYIHSWSSHWQLKLSLTECSVMHLNSQKKINEYSTVDAVYSICECTLPDVPTVTDLGVSYDHKFSFRPHINNIVSKVSLRAKLILSFVTRDHVILCKAFVHLFVQSWSFPPKYGILVLRWISGKLKMSKDALLRPSFQSSLIVKGWQDCICQH